MNTELRHVDNLKTYFIEHDRLLGLSTVHVAAPEISYQKYPFLRWFDHVVLIEPSVTNDIEVSHGYLQDEMIEHYSNQLPIGSTISRLTLTEDFCSLMGSDVIDLLNEVSRRHTVLKVRMMITYTERDTTGVVAWCLSNDVLIDITARAVDGPDTLNRYTQVVQNIDTLTSNVFFDGDKLWIDHPHKTERSMLIPVTPDQLVQEYLKLKLVTYAQYANRISADCEATTDDFKYRDYFLYISSALNVSETPTFIPKIVVFPASKLYAAFLESGWVDTPYGLIKPGSTEVVPVYMLSAKPRTRIEHFPVKSKRQ